MARARQFVSVVAGVTLLAVAGCGSGGPSTSADGSLVIDGFEIADADTWAAAQSEGSLVLYTSSSQDRAEALTAIFTEQTGLRVDMVRLGGGKLNERIRAEAAAGKIGADVITQSDLTLALDDIDAGAFAKYCPPGTEKIEPWLILDDCSAVGLQLIGMGMAYNNAILSEEEAPKSWKDALAGVKGGIATQSISTGSTSWSIYLALLREYGVEAWEALAATNPLITEAAAASQEAVVTGEKALAFMAAPGNVLIAVDNGAPLTLVFPEEGTVAYVSWVGLSASATHPNAAKVYLNWLASPAGQKATADTGDWHSYPGAPIPDLPVDHVPTFDELIIPEAWPEYISDRNKAVTDWATIFNYNN